MDEWVWVSEWGTAGQVIAAETVWNRRVLRVWIPGEDRVLHVAADAVSTLDALPTPTLAEIRYRATAARITETLAGNILLAPLEGRVTPLPHQLGILQRVMQAGRIRMLLADEVGLGKTIEAGLIIRELKLRGLARRILIVVPKGLMTQWASEMQTHFEEPFRIVSGSDLRSGYGLDAPALWETYDQVIVSQDAMKPLERRRGWSRETVAEYNARRFEGLITAGWDLVVVDEAHRLSGTTDTVARFRLGEGLAAAAPHVVLLTATPHQGKTDQFRRLLSLLDPKEFVDEGAITPEKVQPYAARTEKRNAVDRWGQPLFQARQVIPVAITWDDPAYHLQRDLYLAVSDYVRLGLHQAQADRTPQVALRLVMFQRMVASSTAAIKHALENRLAKITEVEDTVALVTDMEEAEPEFPITISASEVGILRELVELAERVEAAGMDAREERLIRLLHEIQQREGTLDIKALIFTEFLPTQAMLRDRLSQFGFQVEILNGQMDLASRVQVQRAFRHHAQILISTEAGGEGLNLQFCHVVVNYDLPWNPMRIEQRIGRIDRIGQTHPVVAYNFYLQDSVEYRVHEVLVEKLATILQEFGIDKLGDVLDSTGEEVDTERLFLDMMLHPETAEERLQQFVNTVKAQAREAKERGHLFRHEPANPGLVQKVLDHPLPDWLRIGLESYLEAHGGNVRPGLLGMDLTWPDGRVTAGAVFRADQAEEMGGTYINLETPGVRAVVTQLVRRPATEPVPIVTVAGLPSTVVGTWSLWAVVLKTPLATWRRVFPLFLSPEGSLFRTTAEKVWSSLVEQPSSCSLKGSPSLEEELMVRLQAQAEQEGQSLYESLLARHQQWIAAEREKERYAYEARRGLLGRIGLPEVRNFRLRKLDEDHGVQTQRLAGMEETVPELYPVLVLKVGIPDES